MAKARKPRAAVSPDRVGKRVEFDTETWQTLDVLARDRMTTFQELADEAFRDLLKKHGRPMDVRDAFRKSVRALSANENRSANEGRAGKKKPAGNRRARKRRSS
jgi:hypothetical protein